MEKLYTLFVAAEFMVLLVLIYFHVSSENDNENKEDASSL